MIQILPSIKTILMSATVGGLVLCSPTMVSAQEITLKSKDGGINLAGTLIEFENNTYIIESSLGPLRISGDAVDCFGDACPDLNASNGPVVWKVSLWGKRRAFTEHVERLAELVAEKTNDEFTLEISYGGLAASNENLDGISVGAFEMAQFCAGYHPLKNPSLTVLELPFLGVDSLEQEIELSMAVYKHPATIEDMARWNATLLMPTPLPQYNLVGTGIPPTSLADFEGMNVRASGGVGDAIKSLGGELVNLPPREVKRAMATGFVDAVSFAPHAHMAFGTIENGTWWTTNLNPGTVNCPIAVNTDSLERLSREHREALTSSVDQSLEHYLAYYNGATMDSWLPTIRDRQIAELTINENIVSSIRDTVAGPAVEAWIKENSARNLPAQEIYDLVRSTIDAGS